QAANTDLVAVGNGLRECAKDFVEKTGFEGKVYCDRGQGSYKLAGMKHGKGRTLNLKSAFNMVRTLAHGYFPSGVQGDPDQQGGVLVITKAGEVVYQFASDVAGQPLPLDAIVAAVKGAAKG